MRIRLIVFYCRYPIISGAPVAMDTVVFDNGPHWDMTNHRFVAPQTGTYMFVLSMACMASKSQTLMLRNSLGIVEYRCKCGNKKHNAITTAGGFRIINLQGKTDSV